MKSDEHKRGCYPSFAGEDVMTTKDDDFIKLRRGEHYFTICLIDEEDELEWHTCPYCREMGYYDYFEEEEEDEDDFV